MKTHIKQKFKKGIKLQITEKYYIKGVDFKVKYQVCNVRIIEIINEREKIDIEQKIKVFYFVLSNKTNAFN